MRIALGIGFLVPVLIAGEASGQRRPRPQPTDTAHTKLFRQRSTLLSEFFGRDVYHEAGVVLPPDRKAGEKLPVCYNIHGFGGSHRAAWSRGKAILGKMRAGDYPRMIYVYLNAQCPRGHHEFADSANNGPCGQALIEELIPALEKRFDADATPRGRFLTGHSSGGWSSFWLQVTYPDFFDGTWSTAPDSVDFRDFTGIDVYRFANAYEDPKGEEIQLMRRGDRWAMTIKQYVQREESRRPYGGQFSSFDYVFSPRGPGGRPMPMFDRKTGVIDRTVAKAWEKYDIRLILKRNWQTLGPKLAGKLRIYMGSADTFRLEGATKLLKAELQALGSDAQILLVDGCDHFTLARPHEKYWPKGMMDRIHREMHARWKPKTQTSAPAEIAKLMQAYHASGQLNGSVLVAHEGKLVFKGGYGYANFDWEIENTAQTKFRLASITKQFTAMAIMQLVQRGKIELDAPITKYLTGYPKASGDKVTVHHLLNHTSGIPSYTQKSGFMRDGTRDRYAVDEFVEKFCSEPLEFEPGSRFAYNNSGYFLLGAIVEAVTGRAYEDVLRDQVFGPAGMANSGYDHESHVLRKRATGYATVLDDRRLAPWIDMSIPYAAGSLYSTVEDLWKWDRALRSNKLLDARLKERMLTPGKNNYAYGWGVRKGADGEPVYSHGGGIFGFNTLIVRMPATDTCMVLLNNTGRAPLMDIVQRVRRILQGKSWKMPRRRPDRALAKTIVERGVGPGMAEFEKLPDGARRNVEPAMNNLGYALLDLRRHADAIAIFEFNTKAFPKSANAWDSLGEGHMRAGNHARAVAHYRKSLELDPSNAGAKRMLAKLARLGQ